MAIRIRSGSEYCKCPTFLGSIFFSVLILMELYVPLVERGRYSFEVKLFALCGLKIIQSGAFILVIDIPWVLFTIRLHSCQLIAVCIRWLENVLPITPNTYFAYSRISGLILVILIHIRYHTTLLFISVAYHIIQDLITSLTKVCGPNLNLRILLVWHLIAVAELRDTYHISPNKRPARTPRACSLTDLLGPQKFRYARVWRCASVFLASQSA